MGVTFLSQALQAFGGRKGREKPFQNHLNRGNHAKELSGLVSALRSCVAPLEGSGPARGHLLPSLGCSAPNLLTLSKGKENNLREITARLNQLWLFCSPGADVIHLSGGQIKRTVLSKLIPTAE